MSAHLSSVEHDMVRCLPLVLALGAGQGAGLCPSSILLSSITSSSSSSASSWTPAGLLLDSFLAAEISSEGRLAGVEVGDQYIKPCSDFSLVFTGTHTSQHLGTLA